MICPPPGLPGLQKMWSMVEGHSPSDASSLLEPMLQLSEKSHMPCIQDVTCSVASQQRAPWYQLEFLWFLVLFLLIGIASPGAICRNSVLSGAICSTKAASLRVKAQWDLSVQPAVCGIWKEEGLQKQKSLGQEHRSSCGLTLQLAVCLDTLTHTWAALPPT